MRGNLPKIVQPLVLEDFIPLAVHDQYAIQSGFHLRFEESRPPSQLRFRFFSFLLAPIDFQSKGNIHRQFIEQAQFLLVEKTWLVGIKTKNTNNLAIDFERKTSR